MNSAFEYQVTFNGKTYHAKAYAHKGFAGSWNSPPESPSIEIVDITDENNNPVSLELFYEMEESCEQQIWDELGG